MGIGAGSHVPAATFLAHASRTSCAVWADCSGWGDGAAVERSRASHSSRSASSNWRYRSLWRTRIAKALPKAGFWLCGSSAGAAGEEERAASSFWQTEQNDGPPHRALTPSARGTTCPCPCCHTAAAGDASLGGGGVVHGTPLHAAWTPTTAPAATRRVISPIARTSIPSVQSSLSSWASCSSRSACRRCSSVPVTT